MGSNLENMPPNLRDQVLKQRAKENLALVRNRTGPTAPPMPHDLVWRATLPYPPTVNTYYRNVEGRTLISKKGRMYRLEVQAVVMLTRREPMRGRLRVEIAVYWPDKRRRDLDNLLKGLLDALEHAGVYENDSQIKDLHIFEAGYDPGGLVMVTVEVMR